MNPLVAERHRSWEPFAALAMGLAMFFAFAGPAVLDPTNIGWLDQADRAMHTAGWWFFAQAPWGLPPGISPDFGIELSSSITFADCLPLFALPFKLLAPVLPEHFQYWGLWFLTCFLLQALFAWRIGKALDMPLGPRFAAVGFCLMMPAFLFRLSLHMALSAHWLILWALYLNIDREPPRRWAWPLVLAIAAAVHAYLLAMVGGLWVASLIQRLWLGQMDARRAVGEVALGLGATVAVLWLVGSFMVGSLGSNGFGMYRANLLSFFDSEGWSLIWPDLPGGPGDYEGAAYLGIGVIALLLPAALSLPRALPELLEARWLPLAAISMGLFAFALSNRIGIGAANLPTIPLPAPLMALGEMFRASGRMIWPLAYLTLFAIVLLGGRWVCRRLPMTATAVMALLVVIQAADSYHGWGRFRLEPAAIAHEWRTGLNAPFWQVAGRHYAKLRGLPVEAHNYDWDLFAPFVLSHDMATDMVYLARIDDKALAGLEQRGAEAVATGKFEADSLYIVDRATARAIFPRLAPADALVRVDGFIVLAPGGADWADAPGLGAVPYTPGPARLLPDETIECGHFGVCRQYLEAGWDNLRATEAWSIGETAEMAFALASASGPATLAITGMGLPPRGAGAQKVTVRLDGRAIGALDMPFVAQTYLLPIPAGLAPGPHRVTFSIAAPVSPISLGMGNESRTLGLGLSSFSLRTAR